ncbi:MAG TPA: aryl-sulfate sulfotransferase [Hellea balneolensis]|uniref:Aryl-sulfate sulfotransferase n=1 Tax=Hellea balneolensis TaxID=287478 RepID=A0A7V5NXR0_9PROT|nr:aryl-sulfate sulfotransferase [Hellea balneolensis]
MSKGLKKRSVSLHGHQTSIALEPEFWAVIDDAISEKGYSLAAFIAALDDERITSKSPHGLAATLRLYALEYVQGAQK